MPCLIISVSLLQVTSQMEAVSQADLVFVAVFPEHHSTLVDLKPALAGKTLVDVSNGLRISQEGPSNAELLADLFPESSVVKGFNTISAWTLQVGPRDGSKQVGHINTRNTCSEITIFKCFTLKKYLFFSRFSCAVTILRPRAR